MRGEERHATAADPGKVSRRLLEVIGIEVAAGPDDDILDPSRDVHLAARDVGEIARLEPVAVEESGRGGGVAVVAARRRGSAELEPALHPLRRLAAAVVHRAHLEPRDRNPARDGRERVLVRRLCRHRAPFALEGVALDPFDERSPPDGSERDPEGRLREAVHGSEGAGREAEGREALRKCVKGIGEHRLRAVERHSPAREVEALDLVVRDAARAQVEPEVRPPGEGAPVAVDGPQPADRAGRGR